MQLSSSEIKLPNIKLKVQPGQLLGSLLLDFALKEVNLTKFHVDKTFYLLLLVFVHGTLTEVEGSVQLTSLY